MKTEELHASRLSAAAGGEGDGAGAEGGGLGKASAQVEDLKEQLQPGLTQSGAWWKRTDR